MRSLFSKTLSGSHWFCLTLLVALGASGGYSWTAENPARTVRVLDVMGVRADQPASAALLTLTLPAHPEEIFCDVLVVGASTGGVAAALAAARGDHSVCLTEETAWIGGQMTAQGVSALDENEYIETTGGTASYKELRNGIRHYYLDRYSLSERGANEKSFNPGNCWVSALCFEPRVALEVLGSMLRPYREKGLLRVFLRTKAVSGERRGNRIGSVLSYSFENHRWLAFRARYVLDATDLGEVLPLVGAEYVTGAESRQLSGEPHARTAGTEDSQSFTYTFVLARDPGRNHRRAKPPEYEAHRDGQPYTLTLDYGEGKLLTYRMFKTAPKTEGPFWTYRRLLAARNFAGPNAPGEISMINWPGNDYCGPGLLSIDPEQQARALREGKITSLGLAYWLQTEVPRDEGGKGYAELELLTSVLGSSDGLSQFPYIRESRRIRALKTIQEQEVSALYQKGARAELFADSVGIGFYPIDIHGCRKQDFTSATKPFQIPLGALVPQRIENLLAASKDIGTTRLTNGAYRLHPVEWAIGEAAGTLAGFALDDDTPPRRIAGDAALVEQLQLELLYRGVPIYWFDDLEIGDLGFRAAQFLGVRSIFGPNPADLHFSPNRVVTRGEGASALTRAVGFKAPVPSSGEAGTPRNTFTLEAVDALIKRGYLRSEFSNPGELDQNLTWSDLDPASRKSGVEVLPSKGGSDPVTRAEFAIWLERVYCRYSSLATPRTTTSSRTGRNRSRLKYGAQASPTTLETRKAQTASPHRNSRCTSLLPRIG